MTTTGALQSIQNIVEMPINIAYQNGSPERRVEPACPEPPHYIVYETHALWALDRQKLDQSRCQPLPIKGICYEVILLDPNEADGSAIVAPSACCRIEHRRDVMVITALIAEKTGRGFPLMQSAPPQQRGASRPESQQVTTREAAGRALDEIYK